MPFQAKLIYSLIDYNKLCCTGFSLRIEVAGGYYKITGESGHSEKNLTSSFYRLMKFSQKIPCSSRRILRSPMLNEHPGCRSLLSQFDRECLHWIKQIRNLILAIILKLIFQDHYFLYNLSQINFSYQYLALQSRGEQLGIYL